MTLMKDKLFKKTLFILLFSFFWTTGLFAQIHLAEEGKEFYVAFGKNNEVTNFAQVELTLRITATSNADVTLSFTEKPELNRTFQVAAGEIFDCHLLPAEVEACYSRSSTHTSMGANNKSVYVTSTQPITLIAVNSTHYSIEAALVFPVENLGTEYIHFGMDRSGALQNSGYLLVATEDNTSVEITPPMPGAPATLQKGEVIYYGYDGDGAWDVTGTHIKSGKPVAYFQSGSRSSITGHTSNYTFEQIPSINHWGTSFILPTTVRQKNNARPEDITDTGGGFARIYPMDIPTVVTVKYTDGAEEIITINDLDVKLRYRDIKLNSAHNDSATACYITSDKPVGVCTYHYPRDADELHPTDLSQPSVAWLPPLEQKTYRVEVSPLDLDGTYVQLEMYHYLLIMTPTASKNKTTISCDGEAPQYLSQLPVDTFTWVADDIGGSGYSFGRYFFGTSYSAKKQFLKTIALIENPYGMIILSYGQGSYTDYFYPVGFSFNDMETGFTVNDESYMQVYGKSFCSTSDFVFEAYQRTTPPYIWKLNGTEIPAGPEESIITVNNLPSGHYSVDLIAGNNTYNTHFWVGGGAVVWTPEANTSNIEEEKKDWNITDNWTPAVIPESCNNVYIPGNSSYYPELTPETNAECRNIYFMQGGELGRPDLLTYQKAYIQYNFGLSETSQEIEDDMDLLLHSMSTPDRMLYSAAISADTLERERWYMLSSPLRKVVTGDLSFGGFPLTFLMKFGPIEKDGKGYETGKWTTPYTSMTEFVSTDAAGEYIPTGGFAFYMYGMVNSGNDDAGCRESGAFEDLNDTSYLDIHGEEKYGIKRTNGILELPFFADREKLYAHRTQIYDSVSNKSKFYYINDGADNRNDINKFFGTSDSITREASIGNYRFGPEKYIDGNWVFQNTLHHPGANLDGNTEFLVGNPYMSSIDMLEFLDDNSATVLSEYKVWNGTEFISYSMKDDEITSSDPNDVNPGYIAPMQSFLLKTVNNYDGTGTVAKFDVEKISKVRPADSSSNLKRSEKMKEENTLRIKAENNYATSYAVIGYKKGANNAYVQREDVKKLFSPLSYVPEVYSLAGEIPSGINFISDKGEVIIPLGIKTGRKGEIRLTFTGMDNYSKASKIELFDAKENRTVDLTGKSSYTYTFNHSETGIQNGRFSLRIGASTTALADVNADDLNVYGDSKGIYVLSSSSNPVQQVIAYDFQGRKLYESTSGANYYPLSGNLNNSPLIVKAISKNQVKTVKLNTDKN